VKLSILPDLWEEVVPFRLFGNASERIWCGAMGGLPKRAKIPAYSGAKKENYSLA